MRMRAIWQSTAHWFEVALQKMDRSEWHKKPLGVFLLYLFIASLAFLGFQTPPPGEAVAALAVAAAIMALLGELRGIEKVAWILLLFGFLWVELTSIKVERKAQEDIQKEARAEQLRNFGDIGKGIQASIDKSDRNFNATMGKTNQVLTNITGGDSFAYVAPQNFFGDKFSGVVWNNGEQAWSGLTLTIAHTSDENWAASFFQPIFIGTLGPHAYAPIPNFLFQPKADPKTGQDNYWIMLSAQNGTVSQSMYFRRDHKNPSQWAYAFQVSKQGTEKPQRRKMMMELTEEDVKSRKGPPTKLLLYRAWSDDLAASAPKH